MSLNLTTVAAGVGLFLAAGYARASMATDGEAQAEDAQALDPGLSVAASIDQYNPFAIYNRSSIDTMTADQSVAAFQAMLSVSEGTAFKSNPYAVCYGYRHTIRDFSQHPAIAEGWGGEPLDSLGPAYVGKVSTAAGKYQINLPTWRDASRALGLTDFTPESQDAACAWLIEQCGALDDVKAGRFESAVAKCSKRWASLPGSTSGQKQQRLAKLRDAYTSAGGYVA